MKLSPVRVLFLVGAALAVASLIIWPKQIIPGTAAQAQTKGKQALEGARAQLEQAIAREKFNPTKQSALAADMALQEYNAAVALRVSEIRARLNELHQLADANGKNRSILIEIEALEAELSLLQPAVGPAPDATPEAEPNNTPATANLLDLTSVPCAIVSAAITPDGDVDYFTFTAPAGSNIWIEADTGGTQDASATSRDTVIDLLAADGTTVIESDDDDGTGNGGDGTIEAIVASMIGGRTLTAGGTYFIRVTAFSGTAPVIINPYRLFVVLTNTAGAPEVESNDTAATANSIVASSGQIGLRSGSISPAGDADYYSVAATAGNIVYFNADADPERDGTGSDLVVEFRDPADVLLLTVDSSITGSLGNPAAEGANFTIATSGTYFVKVRHLNSAGTGTYRLMVSTCSGVAGGDCFITCPANIIISNNSNPCARVTYPAPTTTGPCGTVTCNPPSGSLFPAGTTTVTCSTIAGPACTFTVTVSDTLPHTITCPPNQTAVTANVNDPCAVVNFTNDTCLGVTVVCNPPSGSCFPVGVTTVTCTATDTSGNIATCTFTVSVFNGRLQDDSAGCNNTVLFNTITGAYRWCCNGTIFTGVGSIKKLGNTITLAHNAADRRVMITLSAGSFPPSGIGSIQSPSGTQRCVITDRDTRDGTCVCGGVAQSAGSQ
ncbi:MAG: HYR domain-containing protein [Blastocatellia bacterium]